MNSGLLPLICLLFLPLTIYSQRSNPNDICQQLLSGSARPIPQIKPADEPIRVVAFGDFGDGSIRQQRVAQAIYVYHHEMKQKFDFGITLGDSFYSAKDSSGNRLDNVNRIDHPWWTSRWEDLYSKLNIRFYPILGDHDYKDAKPEVVIARSTKSKSWCIPKAYYTYIAGPVQFFALDTNKGQLDAAQLQWLDNELKKSKAIWKLVYGHHPLKSDNRHGGDAYTEEIYQTLLPYLKNRADIYFAGHDHDLEYLEPEGNLQLFISGGGGSAPRPMKAKNHRRWGMSINGFTVIEADKSQVSVKFINMEDRPKDVCTVSIKKGRPATYNCKEPNNRVDRPEKNK